MRCCEDCPESIAVHLPQAMPLSMRDEINRFTEMNDPNFPRRINRCLRPVIQNAKITSPNAGASTVFITGFLIPLIRPGGFFRLATLFSMLWNVNRMGNSEPTKG
jgi:hypothetical protein